MHLDPPLSVKGMTELDRDRFHQTVAIPYVHVPVERIQSAAWKHVLLILPSMKNVRDLQPVSRTHKQVLFDPDVIRTRDDLCRLVPTLTDCAEESFDFLTESITYRNYSIEQAIKAILPDELINEKHVNTGSGYSLIGHIAHFNLRDEVLPFKSIIGECESLVSVVFCEALTAVKF